MEKCLKYQNNVVIPASPTNSSGIKRKSMKFMDTR